jgi:hypothetical protein
MPREFGLQRSGIRARPFVDVGGFPTVPDDDVGRWLLIQYTPRSTRNWMAAWNARSQ